MIRAVQTHDFTMDTDAPTTVETKIDICVMDIIESTAFLFNPASFPT